MNIEQNCTVFKKHKRDSDEIGRRYFLTMVDACNGRLMRWLVDAMVDAMIEEPVSESDMLRPKRATAMYRTVPLSRILP